MKKVLIVLAVVALLGGAFYGGTLYAGAFNSGPGNVTGGPGDVTGGRGAMGGPSAEMTEEERAAFQEMSAEEQQAYLEEQGIDTSAMPGDRTGGPSRGGLLEGEVVEVASDTITIALADGGSQTVYTDADTIIAYAEGVTGLASGSQVMLFSESETDGVTTASAILVY